MISSSEGRSKLFLHEDQSETVRIDVSVILIPLFWIDIPASSEGIRLHTKLSRAETNNHIELGEEFRPAGLLPGQELGSCKVLHVFVVSDHINWSSRALKVVMPQRECLMDSKKLLVVGIIIELRSGPSPGIVSHQPDLVIRTMERENTSNGIIRDVSFYYYWSVQRPMSEDWSGGEGEGVLELVKGGMTGVTEALGCTLVGEASQRSDNIRVVVYEPLVEISES